MKIKLPLYFKFILGYLAFGLLGFATISTFSSSIMYGHQLESYSETIYDEANLIASSYSSVYQGKNNGQTKKQNMDTAYLQLQAVADFAGAETCIPRSALESDVFPQPLSQGRNRDSRI